jgi:ribonuclease BN (tRNA processing enzyme)
LFYFEVLAAQIFEAAGKDEVALYHFSQAKCKKYLI